MKTTKTREDFELEREDIYWEKPFVVEESIERVKQLEGRGTEFKVKAGLELLWAKEHLEHGDWYAYLYRAGISPDKAQRRMRLSREFLQWGKIDDVVKGIECSKSCILQDFVELIRNRDINLSEFLEKGYRPPGLKPTHIMYLRLSELKEMLDKVYQTYLSDYTSWTSIEKQEAKDTLQMFADSILSLKADIGRIEALSVREQRKELHHLSNVEGSNRDNEKVLKNISHSGVTSPKSV